MAKVAPDNIHYNVYVDPFTIHAASTYIPALERRLQVTINKVSTWVENHSFKFSVTKTVAMDLHRNKGLQPQPSLALNNQQIRFQLHKEFLGLTLYTESTKIMATKF